MVVRSGGGAGDLQVRARGHDGRGDDGRHGHGGLGCALCTAVVVCDAEGERASERSTR